MRLRGLMRKELLQIARDPSSVGIAFALPLVLLLIFGYGVSLDARGIPIAVVAEAPSGESASFAGAFQASSYFSPRPMGSVQEARQALGEHRVDAMVVLRADFSRRLLEPGGAPIQLVINGVDANTARLAAGYVQGAWESWLERVRAQRGAAATAPVDLAPRIWFNPEVRSRNFLVPGLIAVIMTLIGALLTALVMAREWERGTMEALMVTPVSMGEVIAGKLLPTFGLGLGGLALSVSLGVWVFGVPLRGSLWVLVGASSLFLLVGLGLGLLISTVARSQFVAGQVAIIVTFLPAFLLSGFIFDIGNMPPVVQALTHLIPARYYVAILQSVFLAGDVWSVILPNAAALALMAALFLGLALSRTRRSLR
jgi:ABC-2 type transport system permease protein